MESQYKKVRGTLDGKGVLYRVLGDEKSKRVMWDSKTTHYEVVFDLEGEITKARIFPSKVDSRLISMEKILHSSGSWKWRVSPSGYGAIRVKMLEDYLGGDLFQDRRVDLPYPQQQTTYETDSVSDGMTAGTRSVRRQVYHDMNGRRTDR